MPLRDGKKFHPSTPPLDLRLDERVFQVQATGEVFRDYESFYKRSLLCKSLVWSCAYTGKSRLTFSEALKSEEDSRRQVESLPVPVKRAVLEVIHHCQRTSLWQLFEELWTLFKDRYWEEEQVEATVDKRRLKGKVVGVISPPRETFSRTPQSPPAVTSVNGVSPTVVTPCPLTVSPVNKPPVVPLGLPELDAMDTGCLSSGREEEEMEAPSSAGGGNKPSVTQKGQKKKVPKLPICEAAALDPSLYQYRVEVCDVSGTSVVELPGASISRLRNAITREKLRLFVRFATYKQESSDKYPFLVKDSLVKEYHLGERPFAPGPVQGVSLATPTKSPKKRSFSQSSLDSFLKARQGSGTPQKKKKKLSLTLDKDISRHKHQKGKSVTPKRPERKWSKEMLKKMLKRKGMTPKRKERLEGELKKIVEAEREQRKAERDAEREKTKEKRQQERERKREEEERQKEWWKPREDLLCDDLKPLPSLEPLPFRLPSHLFPDAVMVLEYLRLFGPLFDIQGSNVGGVTYAKLEECLMEGDPSSTLFHLLRFLLLALFGTMEDEEEKEVGLDNIQAGTAGQQPSSMQSGLTAEGEAKGPTNGSKGGEQGRESPESNGMATPAGQATPTGEDREDLRPVPTDNQERQAFSTAAAVFATLSLSSQGVPLRSIPLDFCTLPEVLRLHLLSSGQTKSSGDCRVFRYQRRGGYSQCDDPGIDFCLRSPQLLSKMSRVSVYDLLPEEKLSVLGVLCHQLLTYSVVRDALDETHASLKAARKRCRDMHYEIERLKRPTKKRKQKEPGRPEEGKENVDEGGKEGEEEEEGHGQKKGSGSSKKAKPAKRKSSLSGKTKDKAIDAKEGLACLATDKEGITEQVEEEAPPTARIQELERQLEAALAEAAEHSVAINLQPLGQDRWHRAYWWFPSMPGLYVEQPPANQVYLPTPVRAAATASVIAAGPTYQPNHTPKPEWSMYPVDEEHFTALLEALNQRGARESILRKRLTSQKEKIKISTEKLLRRREVKSEPALYDSAEDYMELTLRECLLEVEDNVYCGNLGHVRSKESRTEWRVMLEHSATVAKYERRKAEGRGKRESGAKVEEGMSVEGTEVPVEPSGDTTVQTCLSSHSSRTQTPLPQSPECPASGTASGVSSPLCSPIVRELAAAMLQIEEGVERRFLKNPLGSAVEESTKGRQRRKVETVKSREPCLQRWQSSLHSCTSLSQLAIHWYTLERSIMWSKSLMNLRCRKCCKKGGDEYLLLCDGCDNGFHTYCLDPPLLEIPEGNWFCSKCKPPSPVKLRRVSGVQRSTSQETDEESSDDQLSERESVELGEETGRSRQRNRRNIPLPRRSTRIQEQRPQEDDSDQSEEESSDSEESTDEEEGEDLLSGLQERTERVLEEFRSASRGTRAQNARLQQLHEALLDELMGHPDGWFFEKLPKKSEAPLYYKKIRNPMDLQTLKVKAITEGYLNGELFVESVEQIFSNCQQYHPAESVEAEYGRRLQEYFQGRLLELGLTPKKSGRSKKGKLRISSAEEGGEEEPLPVPEKLLTKTWLALNDLQECQHGTRQHKAKFSAVHECLLEELCVHPDSAPFLKLPSRRQEPLYYEKVEDPVDLHGLKVMAKKDGFASHDQLIKQLRLIISNTREYFGPRSAQVKSANSLEEYLNERLRDLGLESRRKRSRQGRRR